MNNFKNRFVHITQYGMGSGDKALGLHLFACQTCLNHYILADKTTVGIASIMVYMIELQRMSEKIINL